MNENALTKISEEAIKNGGCGKCVNCFEGSWDRCLINIKQEEIKNLNAVIGTLDRVKDFLVDLEDKKAKEVFYAEQAKEKGERDKYFQHFWTACAYGLVLRNLENAVVGGGV